MNNYELIKDCYEDFYLSEQKKTYKPDRALFYSLNSVDYDKTTRKAKVSYIEHTKYRTIEKYVQQNYVKYPVYSNWKIKTKTFVKSVKLDNETLETLHIYPDVGIVLLASQIIYLTSDKTNIPSWFTREAINFKYNKLVERQKSDIQNIEHKDSEFDIAIQKKIRKIKKFFTKMTNKKNRLIKKIDFLYSKGIAKIENNKLTKIEKIENTISNNEKKINLLNAKIGQCIAFDTLLATKKNTAKHLIQLKEEKIAFLQNQQKEELAKITRLPKTFIQMQDFIPLRDFCALKYEQITGCYVIRNNEKNKYYVGQSKDIVKRIKQHFTGTVPKNVTFAEDYYLGIDKENMFSVKIQRLSTKDEMDAEEKRLIELYDSYLNGYNKTQGNY